MGVIHKLKKEVIDFILSSKKENQRLSCRKLADLASDKFDTKISKSSVNTILKEHALSNSVGRPAQKKSQPKFEIPSDKKKEISESLSKAGLPIDSQNKETLQQNTSVIKQDQKQPVKKEVEHETKDVVKSKASNVAQQSEPLNPHLVDPIILKKETNLDNLVENMGCVFLKAALMEMSNEHIISRLFDNVQHSRLYDFLTFAQVIGKNSEEFLRSSKSRGLYQLSGLNWSTQVEGVARSRDILNNQNIPFIHYLKELEQNLVVVRGFRLSFANGKSFILDAGNLSLNLESRPLTAGLMILNAIKVVSRFFVSNLESIPFFPENADEQHLRAACDLINGLASSQEKDCLRQVSLVGENNEEITSLDMVAQIPRNFICGFLTCPEFLSQKSAKFAVKSSFEDVFEGKKFEYSDTRLSAEDTSYFHKDMRIIRLYINSEEKPHRVFITNSLDGSAQEILKQFLKYHPGLLGRFEQSKFKISISDLISITNEDKDAPILSHFSGAVNRLCESLYFQNEKDVSQLIPYIYSLKGKIQTTAGLTIVDLVIDPSQKKQEEALKLAIQKVNGRLLVGSDGSKLLVRLHFQ